MGTIRLTMAQALVRYLAAQQTELDGRRVTLFGGVWAIFGHGNVAGIGEALQAYRADLPTYRAHNEQAMALAAVGYAKTMHRRRIMACTTSIGPGATNMVTAAAVAHVDRLPVLLLPGDVFASRRPDPVLQQVENFGDGTVSANDCFRPVSRYFDRITRPEQIIAALPRAVSLLTDPAECGPVTLALCQDVQAEAFDYPEGFFVARVWHVRRPRPDETELAEAARVLRDAQVTADHCRRWRALFGSDGERWIDLPPRMAFRLPRPRPARVRCRMIIRSTLGRSASPARLPRTRRRSLRMSCWPSVRECRISPPDHGRCSAIRNANSSG